jgi:hypothetical protein
VTSIFVLNFYSALFVDQLRRGRKTATIRLGDKTRKYKRATTRARRSSRR